MKSRSFISLCLFLLVLGVGLASTAQEHQDAVPNVAPTAMVELEIPLSLELELQCTVDSQMTGLSVIPEAPGFGFPLCTSQAQCDAICAPFEGICWRQFCIC